MGNMQAKQEEMKKQLAALEISEEIEGLVITATAAKEIKNIHIPAEMMEDKEKVEDLLLITFNNIMEKIALAEAEQSQKMLQEMLPPGMEGLLGGLDI